MIAIWRSKVSTGAEPVHRISCFEELFRTFRGQTSNRWSRIIVGICNHPTLDFSICIFWLATVNTKSLESKENMFHLIVTRFEVCSMKWSLFYSSSHSIEDESHTYALARRLLGWAFFGKWYFHMKTTGLTIFSGWPWGLLLLGLGL